MPYFTDSGKAHWYYFNRRWRIGPFTARELRSLLAEGAITPATLVFEKNRTRWHLVGDVTSRQKARGRVATVAAMGITVLMVGIGLLRENDDNSNTRTPKTLLFTSAIQSDTELDQAIETVPDLINGTQRAGSFIKYSKLASAPLDPLEHELTELDTSVSGRSESMNLFHPVANFQTGRPPATSDLKPGQLVHEYWRSMATSGVIVRYERYLRDYPQGQYADFAETRIKELQSEVFKAEELPLNKKTFTHPAPIAQRKKPLKMVATTPAGSNGSCKTPGELCKRAPRSSDKNCKLPRAGESELCIIHNYHHSTRIGANR